MHYINSFVSSICNTIVSTSAWKNTIKKKEHFKLSMLRRKLKWFDSSNVIACLTGTVLSMEHRVDKKWKLKIIKKKEIERAIEEKPREKVWSK